jgi:hypothetical protein
VVCLVTWLDRASDQYPQFGFLLAEQSNSTNENIQAFVGMLPSACHYKWAGSAGSM